jgi:hypothetical protein
MMESTGFTILHCLLKCGQRPEENDVKQTRSRTPGGSVRRRTISLKDVLSCCALKRYAIRVFPQISENVQTLGRTAGEKKERSEGGGGQ